MIIKTHNDWLPLQPQVQNRKAGDGQWVQFGNLLPHLFDNFLLVSDLTDILVDPDFEPKQLLFLDPEKHEAFRERMLKRIQEKPSPKVNIGIGPNIAEIREQTQKIKEIIDRDLL